MMCQENDENCTCCKSSLIFPQAVRQFLPSSSSDSTLLYHLFSLVTHQNEVIRRLSEQTSLALKKVEILSKELETGSFSSPVHVPNEETPTSDQIFSLLCGSKTSHQYSLRLVSQLPSPAYKERGFSLMLEIIDRNQCKANLHLPVKFKLAIFTAENPPKILKVNTAGDKIIRGTVEVDSNGVVLFKKVVVKEVTSHFRNGSFFLVVLPKNSQEIRPFIIENFVVKARKFVETDKIKKKKTSDFQDFSLDEVQKTLESENNSETLLKITKNPESQENDLDVKEAEIKKDL
jgi:hypothetical protein